MSATSADDRAKGVPDEPHCAEYQADGVPCETAAGACAECERAQEADEARSQAGPQGEGRGRP